MSFNEWKEVKLQEITENYNILRKPLSSKQRATNKGVYNYYGAQGIIDYIDEYMLEGEYLLIAEDGANLETRNEDIARLTKKDEKFWVNNHAHVLKSNDKSDIRYIKYALNIMDISSHITGSVQPKLNKNNLNKIELILPPIEEQKAIAKILSDLDNKIEVNNKINKRLEDIAQSIFKHWFVDFEFPNEEGKPYKSSGGEMIESELGMIPKGWEVKQIKNIGDVITGKTPSTKQEENYGDKYPFITIPDMHESIYINKTARYLSEKGNKIQPKKLIPKNSLLVSCIATVGLVSINTVESHTNQQINTIVPNKKDLLPYLFFYMKSKSKYLNLLGSSGTTTKNVNKTSFENIKLLYPNENLIKEYYDTVRSIFEKVQGNTIEKNVISNLRETLLPKLMSGEIRVPID